MYRLLGGRKIYNYILTGGSGQLGSYILDRLLNSGAKAILISNKNYPKVSSRYKDKILVIPWIDINKKTISDLIHKYEIKTIFHLATLHGSSTQALRFNHIQANFEINYEFTKNILEELKKSKKNTGFIFAGSSFMYKNGKNDKYIAEDSKANPDNFYGHLKNATVKLIDHYRDFFAVNCASLILFNNSSPRQANSYLLPHLVTEIDSLLRGSKSEVSIQHPNSRIDIGDARDTADSFFLVSQLKKYTNFVIGTGRAVSVIDIFLNFLLKNDFKITQDIQKKLNTLIRLSNNQPIPSTLIANIKKANMELSWHPIIPINKTLSDILKERRLNDRFSDEFLNYDLLEMLKNTYSQNSALNLIAELDS